MIFPSNNNGGTGGSDNKPKDDLIAAGGATVTSTPSSNKVSYTEEELEKLVQERASKLASKPIVEVKSQNIVGSPNTVHTVSKSITIMRRESSSQYFSRNAKFIPEGRIKIGSSINAINELVSNTEEMNYYMPTLVGASVMATDFSTKVTNYFNNISVNVPETGLPLEIGFVYNSRLDYDTIKSSYDKILENFEKADKNTPDSRNKAYEIRTKAIIDLEKQKHKYGKPIKLADYILYRYALVYRDVAVDMSLINNTGHIRFYIYDAEAEEYKSKLALNVEKQALKVYMDLLEDNEKLDTFLWAKVSDGTININNMSPEAKAKLAKSVLDTNPYDLISLNKDKNLQNRSFIEQLIQASILRRLPNSSIIVDAEGDIIGNSMDEAIMFLNNFEFNKAKISKFTNQLKSLKK